MKLAIIGSRGLVVDLSKYAPIYIDEIVSGGAMGIDTLAAKYARENNINLIEFLPEYDKYKRNAPLVRNRKIVDYCDEVLAFWDGISKGTHHTIKYALSVGKPLKVYTCKNGVFTLSKL